MPTLTINGTPANDFSSAFAGNNFPTTGTYYAVDPYGSPPRESAKEFIEKQVSFVGVQGTSTKRIYPFGIRGIYCQLIICGTKAQVETSRASMMDSFAQQARYTISLPSGPTRNGCKLVLGSGKVSKQWAMGGQVCLLVDFEFKQFSENN